MRTPKTKSHAGRRGSPKSTCLEGRAKDTANRSTESVKLPPMSKAELIRVCDVVRSGSKPISEAEFDRFMAGVLFHTAGVRLETQSDVDEYRRMLAKSVDMPEQNDDWREVIRRGNQRDTSMSGSDVND